MISWEKLSWSQPSYIQNFEIKKMLLERQFSIPQLILPAVHKDCWENCATILVALEDSLLLPYIVEICKWFQDLNWPGASIIRNRLKDFPNSVLIKEIECAIDIAKKEKDEEWEENLRGLREELMNLNI